MKRFDRIMAIIRHPEYKRDYDKYCQALNTHDAAAAEEIERQIAVKWGEYPPPTVFPAYRSVEQCQGYGYEDPVQVIDSLPIEEDPAVFMSSDGGVWEKTLQRIEDKVTKKIMGKKETCEKQAPIESASNIRELFDEEWKEHVSVRGRYIYVRVDMSQKVETLIEDFTNKIKAHKADYPTEDGRDKEGRYNPWEVYQEHYEYGLSFAEIARRLSGMTDAESVDPQFRAFGKQVERAYKRACAMIDTVGKKAGCQPLFK